MKVPTIAVGNKVAVPIGTSDVIGTVLELYGTRNSPKAMVEIGVYGSTGLTLDKITTSYPLSALRTLGSMSIGELGSLLRRYRPVAAAVHAGQEPPTWHWEPFGDVQAELQRRGLSAEEIKDLAWGSHPDGG